MWIPDTTTIETAETGGAQVTIAPTMTILGALVTHHRRAEVATPTKTEIEKATVLRAMIVEAGAAATATALVMTDIQVGGDHQARKSSWKDLRRI